MNARAFSLLALLVGAIAFTVTVSPANAIVPADETFEGATGGGSIALTLADNRTKVRRIEIKNVTYPPAAESGCGATITTVHHFDPAVSLSGDGSFLTRLLPVDSGVLPIDFISASGQLSGNTITGSTSFSATNGQPEQGCFSQGLPYTVTGPVATPPDGSEARYAGSTIGYDGLLELHITDDGIVSLGLDGVTGPCGATSNPIDARDFYLTPVEQMPVTGAFTTSLRFSGLDLSTYRQITLAGDQPDADTLSGTMTIQTFVPSCMESVDWAATRVASVGGVSQLANADVRDETRWWWPGAVAGICALAILALASRGIAVSRRRSRL